MKSALAQRAARFRSNSLRTVPPPQQSDDYDDGYALRAASILYRSPLPSQSGLPLYILNAAAFPDAFEVDYDELLPYVLARLPGEDDLLAGVEYEVVFFAGGQPESATGDKKSGPGVGWYIQVYQVLSRALRKRLQKIWIVHERSWVRVLTEVLGTIASPKFKKKVVHVSCLSTLAMHIPIENLLIPPAVYLHDRKLTPDIYVPYATGRRAFAANNPFPTSKNGKPRLPRVLRETTTFLLKGDNIKTEGLFRIPPHSILLSILRESYDRGQRFIVWKEYNASYVEPGMPEDMFVEVQESDAYGVHFAAGLIKVWYRELRIPLIPEYCYNALREMCPQPNTGLEVTDLARLLSPESAQTILPGVSRKILSWHLLPMLSIVTKHEGSNKMTADNLAVCFAPALIRGEDPIKDAKMTSVLRQIIGQAIALWSEGLREACGSTDGDFYRLLDAPSNPLEYEDPLSEGRADLNPGVQKQINGIQIVDNEQAQELPKLPPRKSSLIREDIQPMVAPLPKRKPAPPVVALPRYSTLVTGPQPATSLPIYAPKPALIDLTDEQNGIATDKPQRSASAQSSHSAHSSDLEMLSAPKRSSTASSTSDLPSPMLAPTLAEIQGAQLRSVSADSSKSNDDAVFIKPLWAASSRQASASSVTSNRKPTPPLNLPKNTSGGQTRVDSVTVPAAFGIKPRAPSPGLLQRMQSWEKEAAESNATSRVNSIDARRQSVDDLCKLYEERANTIASMPPMVRSMSNASSRSAA